VEKPWGLFWQGRENFIKKIIICKKTLNHLLKPLKSARNFSSIFIIDSFGSQLKRSAFTSIKKSLFHEVKSQI
jgi:hypothetical protein